MYIIAPISATTRRIKEVSHMTILHNGALYLCPNIVTYVSIIYKGKTDQLSTTTTVERKVIGLKLSQLIHSIKRYHILKNWIIVQIRTRVLRT